MALQHAFTMALFHFLWQGLLAAALLWVMLYALRKSSPNARYAAGCAVLGVLALSPVITTLLLYERAPALQPALDRSPEVVVPMPRILPSSDSSSRGTETIDLIQAWIMPAWYIGVLLAYLRVKLGWNGVATLRVSGEPACLEVTSVVENLMARMGVTKPVRVLVCSFTHGPSVAGWLRPVIFLPASTITGLSPQQLEAILAHEIAHIRRHDYLVNLLQLATETLLFYHPAVWWISARLRQEREYCCDELAVRYCRGVLCYARALTTLEKLRLTASSPALGSTDGPLLERIQRLLGEPIRPRVPSGLSSALALFLGLICIAMGTRAVGGHANWGGPGLDVKGAVLAATHGVDVASQMQIDYPESARSAGQQGFVGIQVLLDSSGAVRQASVLPHPPSAADDWAPPGLQIVALHSVAKWRFHNSRAATVANVAVLFQANPRSGEAFLSAGDFLFHSRLMAAALPRYKAGAAAFPARRMEFLKRQLAVYLYQKDFPAARQKLAEILAENARDPDALAIRASLSFDEGRAVEKATNEFRHAIGSRPQPPPDGLWALLTKSEISLMKGDYSAAIRYARQACVTAVALKSAALSKLHQHLPGRSLTEPFLRSATK